jgi:hypothetical protein
MNTLLKAAAGAVLALAAITSQASAFGPFNLTMPTEGKLVPTKAQLGIISPANNACPGNATLTGWVFTNKPGSLDILIVRKGGNVAGPYTVTSVKGANGLSMATYSKALNVAGPIDAEYRIVIPGTNVASNWAPLQAQC